MRSKKEPLRKCVATQEMKPKREMIRIVKNKEGEVTLDPSGKKPGRGAYVIIEPDAVQKAWDNKTLDKVFGISLENSFYQQLLDYVTHRKARMSL